MHKLRTVSGRKGHEECWGEGCQRSKEGGVDTISKVGGSALFIDGLHCDVEVERPRKRPDGLREVHCCAGLTAVGAEDAPHPYQALITG